jgi:hypothetical protein
MVGDIDKLVQDLEPNGAKAELLNQVNKLRLFYPFNKPTEPSYADLLTERRWNEKPREPIHPAAALSRADNDHAFADKLWHRVAGNKMREAIGGMDHVMVSKQMVSSAEKDQRPIIQDKAFANLTHVAMGSMGNDPWSAIKSAKEYEIEKCLNGNTANGIPMSNQLDNRPIPHFFLTLPSVEHYCQAIKGGPLALAHHQITGSNVPRIVTMHQKNNNVKGQLKFSPPIVLGAVNRWMIDTPNIFLTDVEWAVNPLMVNDALNTIAKTIFSAAQTLSIYPAEIELSDPGLVPINEFETTTIEIYNYIRHMYMSDRFAGDDWDPKVGFEGPKFQVSNNRRFQALMDARLGSWKGKVLLKNAEDCPPCSACGFQGPTAADMLKIMGG